MNLRNILLKSFLLFSASAMAQTEYLVGTSVECIEPDQSLISLHLAGYGAPREGRFSLQWKEIGSVREGSELAGMGKVLYLKSNDDLLIYDTSKPDPSWKKIKNVGNIKLFAASGQTYYGVNHNGELLIGDAKSLKWKKAGNVDKSVNSLCASDNVIFASNEKGDVWKARLTGQVLKWEKLKSFEGITDLAANDRKLFALTREGSIYQIEYQKGNSVWLKAAYRNGLTLKENITKIAISDNRIFGISDDNILYEGEHRTEGNLTARTMAIRSEKNTVLIMNVDVTGMNDTFTGMLKQEIFKKWSIPPAAVFMNFSHTHFAPVTQDWLTWQEANQRPDSVYLYSVVANGILNSVKNAVEGMVPADLYFGRGKTDIGYNRSLKEHPELYDSAVDVIKIDYKESRKESYLFLAACHPVFSTAGSLHYTLSANYPGVARKLVEERTGTLNSLFLQGTAGDINPVDNGEYISGEKLANEVISVAGKPMTKLSGEISFYLDTINLPVTPWSKEEIIAYKTENITNPGDVYAEKNVKWSDLMLKYYNEGKMPKVMPVYVNTVNIGNWKLVGFSRETTTAYALGVKNLWPGKLVSVAGYTNDVSSYLPTHMHLEKRNYEGLDSFFWYGMPNVFPITVEETILTTIKNLAR